VVPDLKKAVLPCTAHRTSLALDFGFASSGGWWVAEDGALNWGKPLADGGGHDINDAKGAALFLEVEFSF
jgi:hypothetical protein